MPRISCDWRSDSVLWQIYVDHLLCGWHSASVHPAMRRADLAFVGVQCSRWDTRYLHSLKVSLINFKGENITIEKPGQLPLNQAITTSSSSGIWQIGIICPKMWCAERDSTLFLWSFCQKWITESNRDDTSDKHKLRAVQGNNCHELFKNTKVLEDKGSRTVLDSRTSLVVVTINETCGPRLGQLVKLK